MPAIDGVELPEKTLEALLLIVDTLPDEALLDFVKYDQEIACGYQPKAKNLKIFAGRLKRKIAKSALIEGPVRDLLMQSLLFLRFVRFLSVETLCEQQENLFVMYGPALVPTLLLDERDAVRRMGIEMAKREAPPRGFGDDVERKAAAAFLDASKPLSDLFRVLLGEGLDRLESGQDEEEEEGAEPDDELDDAGLPAFLEAPVRDEENERLERRIRELQGELEGAREQAKKGRKLQQTVTQQNERNQKLQNELKKEAELARQRLAEVQKLQAEARQHQQQAELRIAAGIQRGLAETVQAWLRQPLAVEKEAAEWAGDEARRSLIDRATDAVKRQAERDRHSGNLRTLREQLRGLEDVRQTVDVARREALNPTPELTRVSDELDREIARIRGVLGDDGVGPTAAALLAKINETVDPAELEQLQRFLDELSDLRVVERRELRTLYATYHARMFRLYDRFTPTVTRARTPAGPIWRLRQAVSLGEPFLLVLDGHNILFCLDDVFGYDTSTGVPGEKAREHLVRAMVELVQAAPKCRVEVFFDSPDRSERMASPNVRVVFSGGGESEHRADRAILSFLEYACGHMSAMPRMLVSDDRDLADKARELRAEVMRLAQFAALVKDTTHAARP